MQAAPAHILVVEDNPDNSQLVTWILEDEDYEVTCVESGEQCLAILRTQPFDLILMDISLPGIDGKEATRCIRCSPEHASTPVLALTAHVVEQEQTTIAASGVDGILTKPIDESLLIETIQKHLG